MELHEPVAERLGEGLAAPVGDPRGVLRREEREVRVRPNRLLQLGDEQLAVIVEEPVQRFEHVRRREVELVQHDPPALAHRLDQRALLESELACLLLIARSVKSGRKHTRPSPSPRKSRKRRTESAREGI